MNIRWNERYEIIESSHFFIDSNVIANFRSHFKGDLAKKKADFMTQMDSIIINIKSGFNFGH